MSSNAFLEQIQQKTDTELIAIYSHPTDYQPDYIALVREELIHRKLDIEQYDVANAKELAIKRKELSSGKTGSPFYILIGFILAGLGGLLGIYIGYIYSRSKIRLTENEAFYVYTKETRNLGNWMMWLGIVVFVVFFTKLTFFPQSSWW